MTGTQTFVISSGDYFVLQGLVVPAGNDRELLAAMLRRKLDQAVVNFPSDMDAAVVRLGSRVRYRVGERPPEVRTLLADRQAVGADVLALLSPHGLALLGLRAGQSTVVGAADGSRELLSVEAVDDREAPAGAGAGPGTPARVLRFPAARAARAMALPDEDDDPGPSAA